MTEKVDTCGGCLLMLEGGYCPVKNGIRKKGWTACKMFQPVNEVLKF